MVFFVDCVAASTLKLLFSRMSVLDVAAVVERLNVNGLGWMGGCVVCRMRLMSEGMPWVVVWG